LDSARSRHRIDFDEAALACFAATNKDHGRTEDYSSGAFGALSAKIDFAELTACAKNKRVEAEQALNPR